MGRPWDITAGTQGMGGLWDITAGTRGTGGPWDITAGTRGDGRALGQHLRGTEDGWTLG